MAEYAAEMRAAGHSRQSIAAKFAEANVTDFEAQSVINEVDLFAGMMGNPHPVDIDPSIREQVDSHGPMLVTEALNQRIDPVEQSEPKIGEAKQTAREMAEQGEDPQAILQYLTNAGAPPDQARQIIENLMQETGGAKKKSRFSRRKK